MSTVFSGDDNEGKPILKPSYEKSGKKEILLKMIIYHVVLSICKDLRIFCCGGGRNMKMY